MKLKGRIFSFAAGTGIVAAAIIGNNNRAVATTIGDDDENDPTTEEVIFQDMSDATMAALIVIPFNNISWPYLTIYEETTTEKIRTDIVIEAMSHIDVMEKGRDNRGEEIDTYLRTDMYSKTSTPGESIHSGASWCAGFVSFVLEKTAPGTVKYNVVAKDLLLQFKDLGHYKTISSDYTPQSGDLIFFERGLDGDWRGHVGIIESVAEDGTLTTIEGNKAHPDFRGLIEGRDYKYDPDRPDGVRRVTYSPKSFVGERILGFGDIEGMYLDTQEIAPAIQKNMILFAAEYPPQP